MTTITMTRAQYDALLNAAQVDIDPAALLRLREMIDTANGITRYFLWIRWQDVGGRPPPRIELGKGWPPLQTYFLELERPLTRADVDDVLRNNATSPVDPQVTPDRYGVVGWTFLPDYSFPAGG